MFIPNIFLKILGFDIETDKKSNNKAIEASQGKRGKIDEIDEKADGIIKINNSDLNERDSKIINIPFKDSNANDNQNFIKTKTQIDKAIEIKSNKSSKEPEFEINTHNSPSTLSKEILDIPILTFNINIEKVKNNGEDAPPFIYQNKDGTIIVMGVADGLGGAGGTVYNIENEKRSGAFLASRVANSIAELYFANFLNEKHSLSEKNKGKVAEELQLHINNGLNQVLDTIDKAGNIKLKIKSNLLKRLPTTLALTYLQIQENRFEIFNFWAGDSRIYLLDENSGLHQLTLDDLSTKGDAYENLHNDSRISNCINVDVDYKINSNNGQFLYPKIVFATTDGAFGYLQSPVHFEYLLLQTLNEANSFDNWEHILHEVLSSNISDDISLSFCVLGYKNFIDLKKSFIKRYTLLKTDVDKISDLTDEINSLQTLLEKDSSYNQKLLESYIPIEKEISNQQGENNLLLKEYNNKEEELDINLKKIKNLEKELEILKAKNINIIATIDRLKDNLEQSQQLLKERLHNFEKYKEQNLHIDITKSQDKFDSLKNQKSNSNKELWLKFKNSYEKYIKK